ncbi:MAG: SbcC/MukB-like Walker B domain-containing protein [Aquificaceae bacterium]
MKPIRIELENFTVYRGRHQIDLGALNFFVIKGKTGSGKSSLIDAICYALFGKVPRHGGRRAHELLISRGQKRMRVALDFSVRGKNYRIEREYTEGGRSEFRFYEEGIRKPFRERELEDYLKNLLRLDYETFIKVIVLPQNQFDKFLKPNNARERREILNSMLGISQILSAIREKVFQEHNTLQASVEEKEARYKELEKVSPKDIEYTKEEIKNLQKDYEKLSEERDKLNSVLISCRERDRLVKELKDLEEKIKRLKEKEKEIEEKRERLRLALELQPYKAKIDQWEEKLKEEESFLREKLKVEKNLLKYSEKKANVEKEFKRVEYEYKSLGKYREEKDRKRDMLQKVSQYMEFLKEKEENERRIQEVEDAIRYKKERKRDIEERLRRRDQLIKEVQEKIKEYEEKGIEKEKTKTEMMKEQLRRLEAIKTDKEKYHKEREETLRKLEAIERQTLEKEEEYKKLKEERESLEKDIQKLRESLREEVGLVEEKAQLGRFLEKAKEIERIEEEGGKLELHTRRLEEELKPLDEELEREELDFYAKEIRAGLKKGDICPVCGARVGALEEERHAEDIKLLVESLKSLRGKRDKLKKELLEHQARLKVLKERKEKIEAEIGGLKREEIEGRLKDVEDKLRNIQEVKKNLERKEKDLAYLRKREEEFLQGLSTGKSEIERLKEKIKGIEKNIERLEEEESNLISGLPEGVEEYIRRVEEDYKDLLSCREKERKYRQELEELRDELSEVKIDLASLEEEKRNLNITLEERVKNLRLLEEEIGQNPTYELKEKLSKEIQGLEERIRKTEEEYESINKYFHKIALEELACKRDLENLEENLRRIQESKTALAKELYPIFERFGDLERVKDYLLDFSTISVIQEEINNYEKEKAMLQQGREKITKSLEALVGLPRTEEIEQRLNLLDAKIRKNREDYGKLIQLLEQIKKNLQEKERLQEEIGELKQKLELYGRLRRDFTDNQFPNYISQLMLERLVERANYYLFKFTSGQYSFELVNEDLQIIDHITQHHRPVSSLSGGETFLASLSLAFAVADILSKDAPIESLFIDEGFGSLDRETRESLGEFFEHIKSSTNRMVGIITHVEDVAEKFTQRIEVEKKGGHAKIRVVY